MMNRRDFFASVAAVTAVPHAVSAASAQSDPAPASGRLHSFPPEWAPHEAVWMGWDAYIDSTPQDLRLRLEMLAALTPHVPVRMVVADRAAAARIADRAVEAGIDISALSFHVQPVADVWVRDHGPLFLSDGDTLQLAGFAWNNYGFPWPYTDPDSLARGDLDQQIAERLGYRRRTSDIVAEGGGLEVNSRSLVTYRDAALHRNPGKTLEEIEAELKRLYGKEQVIWLDRAPVSDRVFAGAKVANFFGWGANGHVDEYVRFVDEETIFVAQISEAERGRDALTRLDHEILEENRRQLEQARDPDGRAFDVVPVPVPDLAPFLRRRTLTEADFTASEDGRDMRSVYRNFSIGDEIITAPAASYLNFFVTNGVVLSARYRGDDRPDHLRETDEAFLALLRRYFPDREIAEIDPLAANWNGGGMHCLTQQQPKLTRA